MENLPNVVIAGRPNVGKSSLFNAILGRRHSIVHWESGVTRDRITATGTVNGRRFRLVDTGGLGMYSGETRKVGFWDKAIERQVETAIAEADLILFVLDITAGVTPLDAEISKRLRATGKSIIPVVNKADDFYNTAGLDEFNELGYDKVYPVSSLHRIGISDLLASFINTFPVNTLESELQRLRIAVIGRPNAGKSSLVNKMLGEERSIVSDVAGTTRDSIDIEFELDCGDEKVPAMLIDTAGLRKKLKVEEAVEHYSSMRAEDSLAGCDIVLFVIPSDAAGATAQDKTIAGMIGKYGKGCIIVANKWDECKGLKQKDVLSEIRYTLPKLDYAPVIFTCALTGLNFDKLYAAIAELRAQMSVKISTAMVNRIVGDAMERVAPPVIGPKPFKVYYGTMTANPPPTFKLFVNDPKLIAANYKIYLEKYIRNAFEFTGFPICVECVARERRELVFVAHPEQIVKAGPGKKKQRIKARKTTVYLKPGSKKRGYKREK